MKQNNQFITILIFLLLVAANYLFAAQRMGLMAGGSASIPPKGTSELPSRCMDEHAAPPITSTDYTQVMNADTNAVTVRVEGKTIPLQEALDKGYVSITGVTSPSGGTYQARIDAVRIINNTNKQIYVMVNKAAVLGESHHKPFSYDPSSLLNSSYDQRSVWDRQPAMERRAQLQYLEAGQIFLEENGKREGVVTLESGLQYEVITAGNGPFPKVTDKVTVHYHGTLFDGKVFDSSVDRGQPISFPVNVLIPGLVEALQLMKVGDKWKLFIPYDLAYGERGAGQDIGPFSTLIFEVELLSID